MKQFVLIVILLISLIAAANPTFFYVITTVDSAGFESAFSTEATAAFQQGDSMVVVSWTAPTIAQGGNPIAGYNVYRGTKTGGPYTKVNTSLVSGVTYTDPFVVPSAPSGVTATPK